MNLKDVLTLLNAGYTRDEIQAMTAGDPTPAPAPNTDPAPAQAPAPSPAPDPAPAPDPNAALVAALLNLAGQNQAQQAENVQPTPAPAPAPAPTPTPAPVTQTTPQEDAAQILRGLGSLVQGVAIPKPETLDERLANTLKLALGIHEETKK